MILTRSYKKKITIDGKRYIYVTSCAGNLCGYTEYIVIDEVEKELLCITVHKEGLVNYRHLATNVNVEWTDVQIERTNRYRNLGWTDV